MSDIFVSYARPDEIVAEQIVAALKRAGHSVWRDDLLPVHRAYAEVIEERLRLAKAVIVLWSPAAAASQWVRSEANRAREYGKLVQIALDGALPPMPFDQIQCADLRQWLGDTAAPGWDKVMRSIAALVGERGQVASEAEPEDAGYVQPPLPQRLAALPALPLVGRDPEIASLDTAWESVQSGAGRIVLIGGEPGIGKTRLASDLSRSAHAAGATVLFGHCDEDVPTSYRPFSEALRFYAAHVGDAALHRHLRARGQGLLRLLPELRERLGMSGGGDSAIGGEAERLLLFEAVEGLLADASRAAPVVLVLDDLQWAGASDLLLLKHLASATAALRLLVLGTFRESDVMPTHILSPVLADLRREPVVTRMSLDGIGADAVAKLLEASGIDTAADRLAETVHASTAGNPFFVGELAHHLAEGGKLSAADESDAAATVPESVREVVDRRLHRLAPNTVKLLGTAAVIGQQFDLLVLEDVVDEIDEDAILDALDEGTSAALIAELPGVADCYRFNHAIVRMALCEGLSGARRRRMHRRIGEALERRAGGDPSKCVDELAYHWSAACDAEKALLYLVRAGEKAQRALAYESAIDYFTRALALIETDGAGDTAQRCDLLIGLATAQRSAGIIAFRQTMTRAADLARALGDAHRLATAALGSGHLNGLQWGNGVDGGLVALYAEALATLGDSDDHLRVRLTGQLAIELRYGSERERRDALTTEAIMLARRLDDPATLARALAARILSIESPMTLDERLALTRELEDLTFGLGNHGLATQAAHLRFDALLQNGDIEAAEQALLRCEAAAAQQRAPFFALFPQVLRAMLALMRGDADAEARIGTTFQACSAVGLPHAASIFGAQMFELTVRRGLVVPLIAQVRAALATYPHVLAYRTALIFALGEAGEAEEARALLDDLAAEGFPLPLDLTWASAVHLLAEGSAAIDDRRAAEALYPLLAPVADQVGMSVGAKCDGALAHSAGLFAGLLGDHDAAAAHFDDAIALNDRIGARPAATASRRAYAGLMLKTGRGAATEIDAMLVPAGAEATALGLINEQAKIATLRRMTLPSPAAVNA
ncbi:AAA family ATPase [Sphingomonas sp. SUN019]|uniref:AAA family ATPase n=1 Tax=Sphingomonas sp. SUN019 TaxID=2937788 RepID=UPI002164A016|nr:AAA family ATPase [Sphingomonas sp. SUN019]UVO51740.1 AAA family ATPase [Sphingomonas sp. SUN019]